MSLSPSTRRAVLIGGLFALSGCSAIATLNSATEPLETFDLTAVAGATSGRRTARTLLVVLPEASAALTSDRIMIRPDAVSVAYLPDARWSDELPAVVQSLLIRSIAGTGRVGYVGRSGSGPVPDRALLVRIDAFEVTQGADEVFDVAVSLALTIVNDRDQRIVASRSFGATVQTASAEPRAVVAAFQGLMNELLPQMADWAASRT